MAKCQCSIAFPTEFLSEKVAMKCDVVVQCLMYGTYQIMSWKGCAQHGVQVFVHNWTIIMLIFWVILDFIDSGQKLGYIYQMDNGHSMWRSLSKNTSTTVLPKYLLQYSNCLIQVTDPQKLWSKFLEWLGNPQIPKTSSVFWWCMRPPRFTSVRGRIVFITASLFAGKRV